MGNFLYCVHQEKCIGWCKNPFFDLWNTCYIKRRKLKIKETYITERQLKGYIIMLWQSLRIDVDGSWGFFSQKVELPVKHRYSFCPLNSIETSCCYVKCFFYSDFFCFIGIAKAWKPWYCHGFSRQQSWSSWESRSSSSSECHVICLNALPFAMHSLNLLQQVFLFYSWRTALNMPRRILCSLLKHQQRQPII